MMTSMGSTVYEVNFDWLKYIASRKDERTIRIVEQTEDRN